MALNPANVATHTSEMIAAAVEAFIQQHEYELGHPGRAVATAGYPPNLASVAAKAVTDAMKAGLAGHLNPVVPADAAADVSNMIAAGIQAAIKQHEIDLAHPGRATDGLTAPPSVVATVAKVAVDLITPDLVTALTPVLNPATSATTIAAMVEAGMRAAARQHEIELAHPGRAAAGFVSSMVGTAVHAVVTPLVAQLQTDFT